MKNHILFLLIMLISYNGGISAQPTDKQTVYSDSLKFEVEKLYIHTDKDTYISGDTIWFKGYLVNSSYLVKCPVSNYIYVELYADTVISRVKIKKSDKGFAGNIQIGSNINPGTYYVRCYTQNMQNYPIDYAFRKKIEILDKGIRPSAHTDEMASGYDIDIQFLPESGRYLINRQARIAFKAVGSNGKSATVKIMLYNSADSLEGQFLSKHNGMGLINLINTESGGYYAMVSDSTGFVKKIVLPQPEISGATINITRIKNKINISTFVTKDIKGAILVISNGSEELIKTMLLDSVPKESQEKNIIFSKESLPYGLYSSQIRNERGEILAERIFFITNPSRPKVEIAHNNKFYRPREKVELTIRIKDNSGEPLAGELSLSITDSDLAPMFINKENIVSYMELSSELRGEIEDPGYYFNNPTDLIEKYLDLVMLTHGWRYHTYGLRRYKREYSQEISGSVSGLLKKDPKNTTLMIFAPSINLQQAFFLQEKNTFTLEGLDFADSTKFLFGVAGKAGGQFYGLNIQKEVFPPLTPSKSAIYNKKIEKTLQSAEKQQTSIIKSDENRILKEVVVVAQEKEFYRPKHNPSPFLQSFSRSQLREREELELYDQVNLQYYLMSTFPGLIIGNDSEGNRVLHSSRGITMNGPGEPLLYVDGLQWRSTALLDQYGWTVMDVENIAFLRGTSGSMFNTINGVILITSRKNNPIQKSFATNTAKISPLGYQKSVEFYSPKYETTAQKESIRTDLRSTLYWNPCIRTDENGQATVTFYTGDRIPKLNITAEGLTITGDFIVSH